jgi:hypothetical protein
MKTSTQLDHVDDAPATHDHGGRFESSARAHALAIAVAVAIGIVVRSLPVLANKFPLNDGGLFYQMILDLRETWPLLPATAEYNGLEIPYAYPPLGFYLGAAFHDVFGGIDTLRILPLILSCLTVPAVYMLARAISSGILIPTAAIMAFALMPRSFEWLLMGGGLTRALGLLLAIIALTLTWRLIERPSLSGSLITGFAGGLTALAHPEASLFAMTGGLLFVVANVRSRRQFGSVMQAVAVAGLVISPWVISVVLRHGLDPFISAGGTQPGLLIGVANVLRLDFSGSQVSPILGILAVLGIILALMKGHWLLPAWVAAVLLLDSRGGATYVTVPAAILTGQAITKFIIVPFWRPSPRTYLPSRFITHYPAAFALMLFIFVAGLVDALASPASPDWSGVALSHEQRVGLTWVAENAPDDAHFVVVSGRPWPMDGTAEWFPVLADAQSVATVQGTEWLGTVAFSRAVGLSGELRDCAGQTASCLQHWSDEWDVAYSHVYVPTGSVSGPLGDFDCCVALRETLAASSEYETVYDGAGATIFARTDPSP